MGGVKREYTIKEGNFSNVIHLFVKTFGKYGCVVIYKYTIVEKIL